MTYEISAISFGEIRDYASARSRDPEGVIPITPERAISQQLNPHAREEEPCLWVATGEGGKVLGFAGSLPALDGRHGGRFGWNTCWWVDPVRGKEAALPLFYHFLSHWDQRVAFGDMTPQTHAIIEKMDFCHTRTESLLQYHVRIPGRKLVSRMGLAGTLLSPLILPIAFMGNALLQIRIRISARGSRGADSSCAEHPDEELYAFIRSRSKSDLVLRTADEFRWIGSHPWLVVPAGTNREIGSRYPFSYVAREFRMEWLVSRENNQITSAMLVSLRDGTLRVLYFYGRRIHARHAIEVLKGYVSRHREVHSIFISHYKLQMISGLLRSMTLGRKRHERRVGISKQLIPDRETFDSTVFQLGDGDSVFT
jgi:hypothetical protein